MDQNHPTITLENIHQLREILTIEHNRARGLAWSPDSSILAVGDWADVDWSLPEELRPVEKPCSVFLFAVGISSSELGKPIMQLEGHQRVAGGLAFSPDGRTIVSSDRSGVIRFWDIRTGKTQRILEVPGYLTFGLAFSPDETYLAIAGSEKESDPWSGNGVFVLWNLEISTKEMEREHDTWVGDVLFNGNGDLLAYYTIDGSTHLIGIATKQEIAVLQREEDYSPAIVGMAFRSSELILVPGNDYGSSFETWNWEAGDHRVPSSLPYTSRFGPAFHPTETLVAVIQRDYDNWDVVHILNWAPEDWGTNKPLLVLKAENAMLSDIAFSPDGRFLAVVDKHAIRLYGVLTAGPTSDQYKL